ncbi:MAG: aldose 1-epimerase [Eubacteriales bacterium]|nr:aldose 1-epimerase [Eubacteriales bacterium]
MSTDSQTGKKITEANDDTGANEATEAIKEKDGKMSPTIKEVPYGPSAALEMRAGGYVATIVPYIGANLISLTCPQKGLDILRTPPSYEALRSSSVVYGMPVLFFPNRIVGGKMRRDGYDLSLPINDPTGTMHIHGFLHSRPWTPEKTLVCNDACIVRCSYTNTGETSDFYKYFPFDFTAAITYTLSPSGLTQEFEMQNTGDALMPFGFGYHTAFRVPFSERGSTETCCFKVSAGDRWEVGDFVIPTGRMIKDDTMRDILNNKGMKANGFKMSKMCFRSRPFDLDGTTFNGAILYDTGCKEKVIYETDAQFGHWLIWNSEGDEGFICIEPQTWMTNAPNLDLDGSVSGYRTLAAGCSARLLNTLRVI